MVGRLLAIILFSAVVVLSSCAKHADIYHTTFTRADSLTDFYLTLQDSVLRSWNIMINDDNQKIKSMKNLLHELQVVSDSEGLQRYENGIDSLRWMRYDQRSMANKAVVAEYDSTSNALAEGLISIAEARREFAYNVTLQKLVQEIRIANQRKHLYRSQYDEISRKYNFFLQSNRAYLDDITQPDTVELRPLFRATNGD